MKRPIARETRYPTAEYTAWAYPEDRYYYGWYDSMPPLEPSDGEIKSQLVDQLRVNPHTKDEVIRVDVEHRVAVLTGEVSSSRAKRAAGDDAWDTQGVVDVSNQLNVTEGRIT
jgi:hypothetical protein